LPHLCKPEELNTNLINAHQQGTLFLLNIAKTHFSFKGYRKQSDEQSEIVLTSLLWDRTPTTMTILSNMT
jgi:hypothetical protein